MTAFSCVLGCVLGYTIAEPFSLRKLRFCRSLSYAALRIAPYN